MTDRPILFSAPMIRALLAGTKTQTRRVVKPQPVTTLRKSDAVDAGRPYWCDYSKPGSMANEWGDVYAIPALPVRVFCPYGQPGDRLWVREGFRFGSGYDGQPPREVVGCKQAIVRYEQDLSMRTVGGRALDASERFTPGKPRPSMFMPRACSRLTLEITGVRVERLQEISETDASAEGIRWNDRLQAAISEVQGFIDFKTRRGAYQELWGSLNGAGSWAANPWVWVVSFKAAKP